MKQKSLLSLLAFSLFFLTDANAATAQEILAQQRKSARAIIAAKHKAAVAQIAAARKQADQQRVRAEQLERQAHDAQAALARAEAAKAEAEERLRSALDRKTAGSGLLGDATSAAHEAEISRSKLAQTDAELKAAQALAERDEAKAKAAQLQLLKDLAEEKARTAEANATDAKSALADEQKAHAQTKNALSDVSRRAADSEARANTAEVERDNARANEKVAKDALAAAGGVVKETTTAETQTEAVGAKTTAEATTETEAQTGEKPEEPKRPSSEILALIDQAKAEENEDNLKRLLSQIAKIYRAETDVTIKEQIKELIVPVITSKESILGTNTAKGYLRPYKSIK